MYLLLRKGHPTRNLLEQDSQTVWHPNARERMSFDIFNSKIGNIGKDFGKLRLKACQKFEGAYVEIDI